MSARRPGLHPIQLFLPKPAASLFAAPAAAKYTNGSVAHLHHHSCRFCLATRIVCFSSVPFLPPIMLFFSFFNDPASLLIMQPLAIQLCSPNFTSSLICKSLSFWLQTLLITPVPSSRKGRKKGKDYVSFILSRFPMDQRR